MHFLDKVGAVFVMMAIILLTLIVIVIIIDLFGIHSELFWIKNALTD